MIPAKRSFAAGEMAPVFHARSDTGAYGAGLRTLQNAYVMRTGGVQSRPGTAYKGTTKGNAAARLIRCVFNADTQNYVIELGNLYVRFWLNGSLVQVSGAAAWSGASVSYVYGNVVTNGGTTYTCIASHTSAAGTEPGVGASWATVWYALSGTTYELPTPYVAADLFAIQTVETVNSSGLGALVLVHPNYAPRALIRTTAFVWSIEVSTFGSSLAAPGSVAVTGSAGTATEWVVTAYDGVNAIESVASATVGSASDLATLLGSPETVSWGIVSGATVYRLYRKDTSTGGAFGLVLGTTGTSYEDDGSVAADVGQTPPEESGLFSGAGNYPGAVGFFQQRLLLAAADNAPYTVRTSRSGDIFNFTTRTPLQDDDMVSWKQVSRDLGRVRHFLDVAGLVALTSEGEWLVEGNDSGLLVGTQPPNLRQFAYNGSASTAPVYVNDTAIYVQSRGGAVRDVQSSLSEGPGSQELSLTASHLVDANSIVQMAFQQVPHAIVWLVRDDGVLLSLTYQRESGVVGWARHVTDGLVESVVCVPESTEMAVYVVVQRTINGGTVRYIERLVARTAAVAALACSDASLTATQPFSTVTVTEVGFSIPDNAYIYTVDGAGGSGSFATSDVGRDIGFIFNGVTYTAEILSRTDANTISIGFSPSDPPFGAVENFAKPNWFMNPVGFSHLEGETVSVQLDGVVAASPYNASYTTVTVTGGVVPINQGYDTAIVGLPFVVDIETLDMDGAGSSRKDAGMNITRVGVWYDESRMPFVASALPSSATSVTTMQAIRALDDDENVTTGLISGYREGMPDGAWTRHGRVALRHVDPSPLTVLAIMPQGHAGRS